MSNKSWCFTLNNYGATDELVIGECFRQFCIYGIYGRERGDSGTDHLQGYFVLRRGQKLEWIKNKFPYRAHYESAKGSAEDNQRYCSKQDNAPVEFGEIPKRRPGTRSDIDEVKEVLNNGGGMHQVIEVSRSYQSAKFAELFLKYAEVKCHWVKNVIWIWGPTGTGKTREAFNRFPDAWCSAGNLQWWDGYDGHENVIIDDFRGDYCKFHELLRILDRYPYRVQTKGGSREFLAKNIVITSPKHPEFVYATSEDITQLLRRITEIIEKKQE